MQEIKTLPRNTISGHVGADNRQQEIRRGDIYFVEMVNLPTGSEMQANRPAVIVSNDKGNAHSPVVEVVYLTTRYAKHRLPTHVVIRSAPRPSLALCENVHTVSKERLGSCMGRVTEAEMKAIDEGVAVGLGLPDPAPVNQSTNNLNNKKEICNMNESTMNIKVVTPYGEMAFTMTGEKAAQVIAFAIANANGAAKPVDKPHGDTVFVAPVVAIATNTPVPQPVVEDEVLADTASDDAGDGANELVDSAAQIPQPPVYKRATAEKRTYNRATQQISYGGYRPKKHKGFLLVRCEDCGAIRGFCAKTPTDYFVCRECGHETHLPDDMVQAVVKCDCGGEYRYRTNVCDAAGFEAVCIGCGKTHKLQYDPCDNMYISEEA